MNSSIIKYTLALHFLVSSTGAFAQDKKDIKQPAGQDKKQDPPKGAITEEIEVVRPYKPVLADAVKIRRNPDLEENRPFKPVLSYTIQDKKL